jgi:Tfp pilus assembly protein PilV
MGELEMWTQWVKVWMQARHARRDQSGFTAVEWLVVALGVITIAGIAVAAVQAFVVRQTGKLGSP